MSASARLLTLRPERGSDAARRKVLLRFANRAVKGLAAMKPKPIARDPGRTAWQQWGVSFLPGSKQHESDALKKLAAIVKQRGFRRYLIWSLSAIPFGADWVIVTTSRVSVRAVGQYRLAQDDYVIRLDILVQ